eukprot:jgi/Chlat1/196/Chrsp1S03108
MSWRASLSRTVQELRIHLCQTGASSAGARAFVKSSYKDLKGLNPRLPILIRECSGIEPKLYARFDFGKEKSVSVGGLDEKAIAAKLEELVKNPA